MSVLVLNKKNEHVIGTYSNSVATVSFLKEVRISFSPTAAKMCNMKPGDKVTFIVIDDKTWCFYIDDNKDGYSVYLLNKGKQGVAINAKAISKLFAEKTGHKLPARYYVQERGSEYEGNKLFEIITYAPINK